MGLREQSLFYVCVCVCVGGGGGGGSEDSVLF